MGSVSSVSAGRCVMVAKLARDLNVSTARLISLCEREHVPGVTDETSTLSLRWAEWVRTRAQELLSRQSESLDGHSRINNTPSSQRDPRPEPKQRTRTITSQNYHKRTEATCDFQGTVTKARNLIESGHYDCAIIILHAAIRITLENLEPQRSDVDTGLIEHVLSSSEHESLRNDLHCIRIMANLAKHKRIIPSQYDTEKALWTYTWLFGPHGILRERIRMQA